MKCSQNHTKILYLNCMKIIKTKTKGALCKNQSLPISKNYVMKVFS